MVLSIVYFGTDEFAAQTLEALATAKGFEIITVVTQLDRPVGRKQEMEKPPVKIMAEKYGLPVIQPETLKPIATQGAHTPPNALRGAPLEGGIATDASSLTSDIRNLTSDIFVVYRYGLIIPQNILDLPTHGTINIHPSLLPKYRGPSPIQSAIMNGDTETGITIMLMDEKMDHGPILAQEKFPIDPDDIYQTLSTKMTPRVNELLLQTISGFLSGEVKPVPQDDSVATITKILTRDDGKIDWSKSANEIYNQYRALTPWPGVWTMWEGKRLKLLRLSLAPSSIRGGTVGGVSITDDRIYISSKRGVIEVLELQLEGKKPMDAKTFLNGFKQFDTAQLG